MGHLGHLLSFHEVVASSESYLIAAAVVRKLLSLDSRTSDCILSHAIMGPKIIGSSFWRCLRPLTEKGKRMKARVTEQVLAKSFDPPLPESMVV